MTTHKHRTTRPAGAVSQAALILSLVHSLDNPRGPLGRRATGLAHKLSEGYATRHDLDAASTVLAQLLDATDLDVTYAEDGLIDSDFDA